MVQFTDEFTRKMVTPRGRESSFTMGEQQELLNGSIDFSKNLMGLHNMKPPSRKAWKGVKYRGGTLDMDLLIQELIKNGYYILMEKIRVPLNPDRPKVALLMDNSSSMTSSRVTRAGVLLALTFIELFGNGFAKSFCMSLIGNYGFGANHPIPVPFFENVGFKKAKEFIVKTYYDSGGTHFSPAINSLEAHNFFTGDDHKFIFVITDGLPEVFTPKINAPHLSEAPSMSLSGGLGSTKGVGLSNLVHNIQAEKDEAKRLLLYIRERWANREKCEYFWLHLGSSSNLLEFVTRYGYCPDREDLPDISDQEYRNYKRNERENSHYYNLMEFYWNEHKALNMIYLPLNDMISGEAFHVMMDYLVRKFKRVIKI